jgi:hypothetical protein
VYFIAKSVQRGEDKALAPVPRISVEERQLGRFTVAVTDILSGPLPESAHRSQLRRAIIASTVGTTIEWYDFLLYSVVTGLVFGKLFFPTSEPLVGVLQAFAVYAVGFLARPIGAAIFGHYGDLSVVRQR